MKFGFDAFFEATWGHAPFPWQSRLAEHVSARGWPHVLDLPTGSGKTAALDVALYHLAADGGRTAPRRIVLVVDRRVIVDQVARRALALRQALEVAAHPATREVASRLREIVGPGVPLLETAVLRGATVRDDAWARYPQVPVLAASTVDQLGSRLFFRGYGVSDGMKPIHAGLLGCDTLLLLDEVHLARAFADVLEQLQRLRGEEGAVPRRFAVTQLSATPGSGATDVFRLAAEDRRHPVLARRLEATKPTRLREVQVRARDPELRKRELLARAAAISAREFVGEGARAVAVVVNRVDTACRIWEALDDPGFDRALLTGRMRPFDQQAVLESLRPRVMAGRIDSPTARPAVLVATQCLEAGADFDFDGLVTECAPLDALRQRFGRLDRLGERPSRGLVLCRSDQAAGAEDAVYGGALARTWHWLQAEAVDGEIDLSIEAVGARVHELGGRVDSLRAPSREAPVLMPAYLDQWVQTSERPHADPDVSLFLHGIPDEGCDAAPDVQVVWRADVSEAWLEAAGREEEALRRLVDSLAVVRPGSLEVLSLPLWSFRKWLSGLPSEERPDDLSDADGVMLPAEADGEGESRVLVWRGRERSYIASVRDVPPDSLVVVPASRGGLGIHGTFDPRGAPPGGEGELPVRDLGDAVQLVQRGRPTLRLDPRVLVPWSVPEREARLPSEEDADADVLDAVRAHLGEVLASIPSEVPRWLAVLQQALSSGPVRLVRSEDEQGRARWSALGRALSATELRSLLEAWPIQDEAGSDVTSDEDDGSFIGVGSALEEHLAGVGEMAEAFARGVGLPEPMVVGLRWAGRLHDLGKIDPRFQLWLHGGDEVSASVSVPLAKSSIPSQDAGVRRLARARAGYPPGQRHELVSLEMIEGSGELQGRVEGEGADWDLVLHLVASHHGWCRPLAPAVEIAAEFATAVTWKVDGVELEGSTCHQRGRVGSGTAERFWRLVAHYGWHELAYLEAILRLADHRRSAIEQAGGLG